MYREDNTQNQSERISEDMLRRMLDGEYRVDNNAWERRDVREKSSCNDSNGETMGLRGYPLASVYAPLQEFKGLYDKETSMKSGTLFSELDLPFMGESISNKGGSCRG